MAAQAVRCGMPISEFWKSNPWELRVMGEGYGERIRDTQELHASMTAALMNVTQQLKNPKRWTVAKLVGTRKGNIDRTNFNSSGEFRDAIRVLQEDSKDDTHW
jgi:hypothetical protein